MVSNILCIPQQITHLRCEHDTPAGLTITKLIDIKLEIIKPADKKDQETHPKAITTDKKNFQ